MTNLFNSLISLVICIFFLFLGIIAVMLPWWTPVRQGLAQFILDNPLALFFFGLAFLIVGGGIAAHIIVNSRRKYYTLHGKNLTVSVDENLIQNYLNVYWKELFPSYDVPSRLTLKPHKIEIFTEFPYVPEEEHQALLTRIHRDLENMFSSLIEFDGEITLTASFENKK